MYNIGIGKYYNFAARLRRRLCFGLIGSKNNIILNSKTQGHI